MRLLPNTYYKLIMQAIVQWGFFSTGLLQDSSLWSSTTVATISEDGVLGLVYERGLRQGSVRAEANR